MTTTLAIHDPDAQFVARIRWSLICRSDEGVVAPDAGIEQPMTVVFVVNLKTAQALGLTFPNEILLQVTESIQ